MRWLAILVAAAAVLWGGWWFVGSTAFERGALMAIDRARGEGWDIAYDDLSVAGFPNRFDTTIDAPRVTAPGGAISWSAAFLQVFALSYQPQHLIAVPPHEMEVTVRGERIAVTSADLRASARFTVSNPPLLARGVAETEGLVAVAQDWRASLGRGQVTVRRGEGPRAYDAWISLRDVEPGEILRARIDPGALLPPSISLVEIEATPRLPTEADLGGLEVRRWDVAWGDLRLGLVGAVTIAPDGQPEGRFTVDVTGWRTALALAQGLGLVDPARLPLVEAGLAGMAKDDGKVTFDLIFADGQIRLGAIPLGPVPRLDGLL